jgi:hypothetical protein
VWSCRLANPPKPNGLGSTRSHRKIVIHRDEIAHRWLGRTARDDVSSVENNHLHRNGCGSGSLFIGFETDSASGFLEIKTAAEIVTESLQISGWIL